MSNWFFVPFGILVFSVHILLNQIKCPNCGMPVTYEGETKREGPFAHLGIPSAFFHRNCANCGYNLNN